MPSFLQIVNNPYLNSVLHQTTFFASETAPPFSSVVGSHEPQYLKPSSSCTIVDYSLDIVKPSNYTRVSTDDDLMRLLLKSYYEFEYTWWPTFHKDSFLEDMLSGTKGYCSSLQVNAILAHACVSTSMPGVMSINLFIYLTLRYISIVMQHFRTVASTGIHIALSTSSLPRPSDSGKKRVIAEAT